MVNIDAEVLTMNTPLQIINPNDQVVVFNVINSSSALNVQSPIKYNDRSNHETEDFSDANISWNFGNEMTDLTISAPFQEQSLRLMLLSALLKTKTERL